MERQIPGTEPLEEGREFRHIQGDTINNFEKKIFNQLFDIEPMNATYGGALSENCKITTENGIIFFGLSYRGDILGWRKDFEQGAYHLKLIHAKIEKSCLADSLGRQYPLSECIVEFY